ncbi:MAG: chromosomal replication initiator protein DnaA [Actinomycetota bacterium]|nr:chromosomal replication initiator protein DnaA [Actinomycetota bacterium]
MERQRLGGDELWSRASDILRIQIADGVWQSTFAQIVPMLLIDDRLVLSVPNAIIREKLDGRYRPLVEDAITESAGHRYHVEFDASPPQLFDPDHVDGYNRSSRDGAPPVIDLTASKAADDVRGGSEVTLRYNFETFVIGPSNRFAHAAALSVAERPGGSYNPLFIYGGAGLGKTHLLRAIEAYVCDVYPRMKVQYVSTEAFLNEFVESIKTASSADFKRRYRQIDVLLVDDIQFIAGKDGLQEEFFHTFNELYGGNRQVVLTSDRPPDAIPTLEDRLRSRFMMGLLTDIQPPDIETRMAILSKKADRDRYFLASEVSEFIAHNITSNIRELEGALNKVIAFANLNREPMTRALAERILGDFIADRQPRPINVTLILNATAERFNFTIEELVGKSRRRPLVSARQMAMYIAREHTDLSFPLIAREFGGRDHTTVMYACDKISALMKERSQIYEHVMALEKAVRLRARAVE